MLFISPERAKEILSGNIKEQRLQQDLTQKGLSERSGVPLPTLRRFEQHGDISLEALVKLLIVLGSLEKVIKATEIEQQPFTSIDEVLVSGAKAKRKRGRKS